MYYRSPEDFFGDGQTMRKSILGSRLHLGGDTAASTFVLRF